LGGEKNVAKKRIGVLVLTVHVLSAVLFADPFAFESETQPVPAEGASATPEVKPEPPPKEDEPQPPESAPIEATPEPPAEATPAEMGPSEIVPTTPPTVTPVPTEQGNQSQLLISPPSPIRYGLIAGGLGAISRVDYDPDISGGFGWTLGIHAEKLLTPSFRLLATLGYQSLSVGRFVASKPTAILDQYSQFIQTQKGPFGQLMAGIFIWKNSESASEPLSVFWDAGFEYFHPLSALQTTSFNTEYAFDPSRFVFFETGPSLVWDLRGDWELSGNFRFFMNLSGESRFDLFGGRLTLALTQPL